MLTSIHGCSGVAFITHTISGSKFPCKHTSKTDFICNFLLCSNIEQVSHFSSFTFSELHMPFGCLSTEYYWMHCNQFAGGQIFDKLEKQLPLIIKKEHLYVLTLRCASNSIICACHDDDGNKRTSRHLQSAFKVNRLVYLLKGFKSGVNALFTTLPNS